MEKYLAVVDFEATCNNDNSFPRNEMNIIELGCVIFNTYEKIIEDKFQSFVEPVLHPNLTDFCKSLTGITQDDVDSAPELFQVIEDWNSFLQPYKDDLSWGSWGMFDKNILTRESRMFSYETPIVLNVAHFNLKNEWAKRYNRKPCGVSKALRITGMGFEGQPHRAIYDAINITRLIKDVF